MGLCFLYQDLATQMSQNIPRLHCHDVTFTWSSINAMRILNQIVLLQLWWSLGLLCRSVLMSDPEVVSQWSRDPSSEHVNKWLGFDGWKCTSHTVEKKHQNQCQMLLTNYQVFDIKIWHCWSHIDISCARDDIVHFLLSLLSYTLLAHLNWPYSWIRSFLLQHLLTFLPLCRVREDQKCAILRRWKEEFLIYWWKKKYCKSLWIKASAKCINVNVNNSGNMRVKAYLFVENLLNSKDTSVIVCSPSRFSKPVWISFFWTQRKIFWRMLETKQLMVVDFHNILISLLWKSKKNYQTSFFCVQQKKEAHTGLEKT